MSASATEHAGMRTFFVVWLGQFASIIGSGLTRFALGVWVYEQTGSVARYAIISTCAMAPTVLLMPIAGAIVDRWDRRRAMMLADSGAGACTLAIAILFWVGRLETWHICVAAVIGSACQALHFPAYSSSVTLLVPKRHLGRAAGLISAVEAAGQIVAPVTAGFLVKAIGLGGVIAVDFSTFLVAVSTLAVVRFRVPEASADGASARGSLLGEVAFGGKYLWQRPGLLALMAFFFCSNFALLGVAQILVTPLVLGFGSPAVLGSVLSAGGIGALLGSALMGAWGGPVRRIRAVLVFTGVQAVFAALLGVHPSAFVVGGALFGMLFCFPLVSGSAQAIWQSKVPPDLQGRVFAIRRMFSWSSFPLAYLCAGLLADRVFVPLLQPGGALADTVGRVLGTGPGRGIALADILAGAGMLVVVAVFASLPRLQRLEEELPDRLPDALPLATPLEDTP